ncbi:MAG: alpha/beta hydrolase [Burkholderiaceae bacterium]|nr:alpha/beta hydrolase [Burkholderiaceae bacterium]
MDIGTFFVDLPHGVRLSCRSAGATDAPRRIVLLHGFPEAAFVWDRLMGELGTVARCVAPNLRGYERSSAPTDVQAYRAKHLVQDIEALIESMGGRIDVLVAHDWGGGVAWNLAALRPQRLGALVILNSPHPAALLRELRNNPAQRAASAYMDELVKPDAASHLAVDDFAPLWASFERAAPAAWLSGDLRGRYRDVWSCGLDGALNFYRASPLRPGSADLPRIELPTSVVRVRVQTHVVWGMKDHALLPGLLDGLDEWVAPLRVRRVPDASHWIVHEKPDLVRDAVVEALRRTP